MLSRLKYIEYPKEVRKNLIERDKNNKRKTRKKKKKLLVFLIILLALIIAFCSA